MRWLVATVAETFPETARTTTLRLDVPIWSGHRAGQHVDVRLTAEDGYQAQRSYSIASPPGADRLELTVVRIEDGEVSPYLTTNAEVGDQFELRGPIGGWFVWDGDDTTPVLLVGGGSGVVPLMAMMRHHARSGSTAAMQLVYSARTLDDVIYRDELRTLADSGHRAITLTLTRDASPGWTGTAVASTPPCSSRSAGHQPFDPAATCVDPRRSSKPSAPRSSASATRPPWSRPNASDRQEHEMNPTPLDGNVAAGDLADIFAFDATTAVTTCATCRHTHPIATLRASLRAPGMVLRCASCDAVQIRLVRAPQRLWLDLRGIDMLAITPAVTIDSVTDDVAPSRAREATR